MRLGKDYVDYETCQVFAIESGFKNKRDWQSAAVKGYLPEQIPKDPSYVYSRPITKLMPLEELKKIVRKYNIKSQSEYGKAKASKILPDEVPGIKTLYDRYTGKGWKGFGDFLGTGRIADQEKKNLIFKDFETCRNHVRKLKLKNAERWYEYSSSKKKPVWIPTHPERVFKKDWISFSDWIGMPNKHDKWSYKKSRQWILKSGFKINKIGDFNTLRKKGLIPKQIPASPPIYYRRRK